MENIQITRILLCIKEYLILLFLLTVSLSEAGAQINDPYCLDSINALYVKDPDLALVRMDSLRRRCEATHWEGVNRARLEMINSIIYTYKEDSGNTLRYGYAVLAVTEKLANDDEVFWRLMALQYISLAYSSSENWFMTARTVHEMELLARKYGGRYAWYESVAEMIRTQMLVGQKKTDQALQAIDRAEVAMARDTSRRGRIIAFQNWLDTERFRAGILADAGRNEQAKKVYQDLLRFVETGDTTCMDRSLYDLTHMRIYAQLCGMYQQLGHPDSAATYYNRVIELQREYREGHSLTEPLSAYLYQSGNDAELERMLLPVLQQALHNGMVSPGIASYMETYIRMLHRCGRLAECAQWSEHYMTLNDSLQAQTARRALDEFVVVYEAKEQEELVLEQEHALFRKQVWIVSLAVFICLLVGGIVLVSWLMIKHRRNNRFLFRCIQENNAQMEQFIRMAILAVPDTSVSEVQEATTAQTTVAELRQLLLDGNYFLNKQLSTEDILRHFDLSHDTLNKRLQSVIGMSLVEYLTFLRLDHACKLLLETNLTIDAIAHESGFNSSRTFLRQFKTQYNLSPTQFRREKK